MGNNKNKKVSTKGQASKKSSSSKTSSDQKENRPKKVKVIKTNPDDCIEMSQELKMHTKKKSRNRSHAKRQSKNSSRILPNGKIMPSLADLEKMFEDSEDDADSVNVSKINSKDMSPVIDLIPANDIIPANIDILFSPSTCARVVEQAKKILNNSSKTSQKATASTVQTPPRKRLKYDAGDNDECDDLPLVVTTPKKAKYDISNTNQETETHHSFVRMSPLPPNPGKNVDKLPKDDDGNLSETSTDSNKTIEYRITTSTLQNNIISQAFSPLPSTSRDDKTFSKNDELFFKCTKEINNNKPKETITSSQITETPTETITPHHEIIIEVTNETDNNIQNEVNNMTDNNIQNELKNITDNIQKEVKNDIDNNIKKEVKNRIDNNIQFVDLSGQNNLSDTTNPGDQQCDDDDDDCIFVDSYIDKTKQVSREPDIIDLEYDFIDTNPYNYCLNSSHFDNEEEIIDVDALIAKNQLILNKYKTSDTQKLDTTNLVVDVDVSDIVENSTDTPTMQKLNNNKITAPVSNNTLNLQGNPNNQVEVINITVLDSENESNNQELQNLTNNQSVIVPDVIDVESATKKIRNQYIFTEHDISGFFNGVNGDSISTNSDINSSAVLNLSILDLIKRLDYPASSQATPHIPTTSENTPHAPIATQRTSPALSKYQQTQSSTSTSQRTQHAGVPHQRYKSTLIFSITAHQKAQSLTPVHSTIQTLPPAPIFQQMQPVHSTIQKKPNRKKNTPNKTDIPPSPPQPPSASGNLGDCPICMERLSDCVIASTICGHVFCMRCLEQAIKTNKRCPTCRKIIKKNGYHQIFL